MAKPVSGHVTIYAQCQKCGPNAEHGFCASRGAYVCRGCGSVSGAPRPAPSKDTMDRRGAEAVDAVAESARQILQGAGLPSDTAAVRSFLGGPA